jgi:hypothetical protein
MIIKRKKNLSIFLTPKELIITTKINKHQFKKIMANKKESKKCKQIINHYLSK